MPASELIPCPELTWRVLDNDTGAVIIQSLWHPHQSSFIVRALLPGMPASAALGEFTIPLYGPQDPQFDGCVSQYLQLARGQRVEAYVTGQPTNTPKFSGIITKEPERPLKGRWSIAGADTLWLLQQSQGFHGEAWLGAGINANPNTFNAKDLFAAFYSTRDVVWDDDFSNWGGTSRPGAPASSDYTNSGFVNVTSDPYQQKPAMWSTATGATIAWMRTNTTWGINNQFSPCEIRIQGTMHANDAGPGGTGCEAGIIFLADDASAGSGVLVRAILHLITTGVPANNWSCDVEIWSFSAGTYTNRLTATGIFTPVAGTFTFDLSAVKFIWGNSSTVRAMLNGKDCGVWTTTSFPATTGGVGLRFNSSSTTGSPAVYVNKLKFESRIGTVLWGTPRFGQGLVTTQANSFLNNIELNGQTHLDMILIGAARDGVYLRKTPGNGYKNDRLDYYETPGSDLTQEVVFEDGVNVTEGVLGQVADVFATEIRMTGRPNNNDSGGTYAWSKVQKVGDAALIDTVADYSAQGIYGLRALAEVTGRRKAGLQLQAKELTVLRTPETADRWRELDYVTFHCPRQGIWKASALVISYDYREGATVQKVVLDNYPDKALVQNFLQRMRQPIEQLAASAANRTF